MRIFLCSILLLSLGSVVRGEDVAGAGSGASPNPYRGMQERAEVYAFARKPEVKPDGGKLIITFAVSAACDATVAILNKDGKVIRHLASGVLGKNAPDPFQQDTLAQRLEWDGTDDDGGRARRAARPG